MSSPRVLVALALASLSTLPAAAQWSTGTLSEARAFAGAVGHQGEAWFAGGIPRIYPGNVFTSDVVDRLDVATGTWTTLTLSSERARVAAAAVGTKVLFGGGVDDHGDPPFPSPVVDVFDLATGVRTTTSLSLARQGLAAVTVDDLVLFSGGEEFQGGTDVVDVYDDTSGTWSVTALSVPRARAVATAVGSRAYVTGEGSPVVDVFDGGTGLWSTIAMPTVVDPTCATRVGTRAVFSDGTHVDAYDASTGVWTTLTHPVARLGVSATSVGEVAFFASGYLFDDARQVWYPAGSVDLYDFDLGSWVTRPLAVEGDGIAAVSVGGTALFAGGGYWPLDCGGFCEYVLTAEVDAYGPLVGSSYCGPAEVNSGGRPAVLAATGDAVASANDLTLWASDLPPGEWGYFLTSETQGFVAHPGGSDGNLCLGGTIGRFAKQVRNSGEAGAISVAIDLTSLPPPLKHAVVAGETWNFQGWFRDGSSSNFTHGVSVTFD